MKTKHEIRTGYKFKTGEYWDALEDKKEYTEYLENEIIRISKEQAAKPLEKVASDICHSISFSLLDSIENELNADLENQWRYFNDEARYKKLRNLEPFSIMIQKIEARLFQIDQIRRRISFNES